MPKLKTSKRHQARALAFQVLYGLSFAEVCDLEQLKKAFLDYPKDSESLEQEVPQGFAWELVSGVYQNLATLDDQIKRFIQNWSFERIGHIELTLLRLAMFELLFMKDTPAKVVINEALELSHDFGDLRSNKFINGILDAAVKELPVSQS